MHNCNDDNCARSYTLKDISSLLSRVDYDIWKSSVQELNELKYGYRRVKQNAEELVLFKFLLTKKLDSIYNQYDYCLCDDAFQKLVETFSKFLTKAPRIDKSIITDESLEETWILSNPNCVSKETWEECACNYVKYLGLDITVTKNIKELMFDIEVTPKFKDILLEISATRNNKSITFEKSVTNNYQVEFDTLVKNNKFNLTFDQYYTIRNSGITFDTVRTAYKNNIYFSTSVDENDIHLCTNNCNYQIT